MNAEHYLSQMRRHTEINVEVNRQPSNDLSYLQTELILEKKCRLTIIKM